MAVTSVMLRGIAFGAAVDSLRGSAAAQTAFQEQRYRQLLLISRVFAADANISAYLSEAANTRDTRSILDLLTSGRATSGSTSPSSSTRRARWSPAPTGPRRWGRTSRSGRWWRPPWAPTTRRAAGVWREGDDLYYAVAVPVVEGLHPLRLSGHRLPDQRPGRGGQKSAR